MQIEKNVQGLMVANDRDDDLGVFMASQAVTGLQGTSFTEGSDIVVFIFDGAITTPEAAESELTAALSAHAPSSLNALKAERCAQVNALRDEILTDRFPYAGKRWDCDAVSQMNITGRNAKALNNGGVLPVGSVWKSYDNEVVPADAAFMRQMGDTIDAFRESTYGASWIHKATIASLADAAAVNAYDFSTGWPARD